MGMVCSPLKIGNELLKSICQTLQNLIPCDKKKNQQISLN